MNCKCENWGSIRRMVTKETVGMLCLQETKKEAIDKALCQALWGYSEVKWELNPTINSPGGMLCLWSEATFKMENKITGSGFIFLQGIWHGYEETYTTFIWSHHRKKNPTQHQFSAGA